MDLTKLKHDGYNLKSNWQELNSKSIFFTYTKSIKKFEELEILCIKKKCNYIICDYSLKKSINKKIDIKYSFHKDLKDTAIYCSDIFYAKKNIAKIILVTGTNGKTSISYNLYDILNNMNIKSAYVGTLGFYASGKKIKNLLNTTPDLITLMSSINEAEKNYKCKYIIIEASSIGFIEKRLGKIKADIGILTNLTQDHLDYHGSLLNYHKSKISLLKKHLKKDSTLLIQDKIQNNYHIELNKKFNTTFQSNYMKENNIQLIDNGYFMTKLSIDDVIIKKFNLPNNFIIKNLLTNYIFLKLIKIKLNLKIIFNYKTVKGRHHVIHNKFNKLVIVDYAHTPDGIYNLLSPYKNIKCSKIVIFGCGGDRDKGKRPKMAKVVNKFSNIQIITDDNPRNENPKLIRNSLIKYCDNSHDIGNRLSAIKKGFNLLNKDLGILFILGKGHEEEQLYKNKLFKFSDIKESIKIAKTINS